MRYRRARGRVERGSKCVFYRASTASGLAEKKYVCELNFQRGRYMHEELPELLSRFLKRIFPDSYSYSRPPQEVNIRMAKLPPITATKLKIGWPTIPIIVLYNIRACIIV